MFGTIRRLVLKSLRLNHHKLLGGIVVRNYFWVELIEEEEGGKVEVSIATTHEEQLEISLNAIIGVSSMQNILLEGELGTKSVLAL